MEILVTGGAGYIGVHTIISLILAGYKPIVVDNLVNSSIEGIRRIEKLKNTKIKTYICDLRDANSLNKIFSENDIQGVIHLAGLKSVGESTSDPISYYDNNVTGTLVLLKIMEAFDVKNLIFSSSATVYGVPKTLPIKEDANLLPTNPYGQSKLMIEQVCRDLSNKQNIDSKNSWKIALLRYFNPIGADKSGAVGEDSKGIPNNVMPYLTGVASGKFKKLSIFGDDYPTKDGTGVRDYIHVMDLAEGHVAALRWVLSMKPSRSHCRAINLGTGNGTSVLELINIFEEETGAKVPVIYTSRRPGDVASCFADPSLAYELLNWKATRNLAEMVSDTWRWQEKNPKGYDDKCI